MLVKNRMHQRNIYKNPPNFKELAIEFEEFRKYLKQELSGKLTIDYQDPRAVKALTQTLLKKDFGLDVDIIESRLIPRVPLCLNYLLWVEDLLGSLNTDGPPYGIDIGTGCACIYSLLAAKKGWKMLATEVDHENFKYAQMNVNNNNLSDVVTVKLVSNSSQLLTGILDEKKEYSFCMCNPPFFNFNETPQNRTSRRQQLETVASNASVEILTEGGEISFISRLIKESQTLKNQVKIYTTLVGKKADFLCLKKEVQKAAPKSMAFTEFCQGRTIRWGLAWSFLDINLKESANPELSKNKKTKAKPPLQCILPSEKINNLNTALTSIKEVLNDLKIVFTEKLCELGFMLQFKAYEKTWSHQRRKKRLKARNNINESETGEKSSTSIEETDGESQAKRIKLDESGTEPDTIPTEIVEGVIVLKDVESSIIFQMSWMSGNKEALHEIFQYFKNHWGIK